MALVPRTASAASMGLGTCGSAGRETGSESRSSMGSSTVAVDWQNLQLFLQLFLAPDRQFLVLALGSTPTTASTQGTVVTLATPVTRSMGHGQPACHHASQAPSTTEKHPNIELHGLVLSSSQPPPLPQQGYLLLTTTSTFQTTKHWCTQARLL